MQPNPVSIDRPLQPIDQAGIHAFDNRSIKPSKNFNRIHLDPTSIEPASDLDLEIDRKRYELMMPSGTCRRKAEHEQREAERCMPCLAFFLLCSVGLRPIDRSRGWSKHADASHAPNPHPQIITGPAAGIDRRRLIGAPPANSHPNRRPASSSSHRLPVS